MHAQAVEARSVEGEATAEAKRHGSNALILSNKG